MKRKHILGLAALLTLTPIVTYVAYSKIRKNKTYNTDIQAKPNHPMGEAYLNQVIAANREARNRMDESGALDRKIITEQNRLLFEYLGLEWLGDQKYSVVKLEMDNCGACDLIRPPYKKVKDKYKGDARFVEINTSKHPSASEAFQATNIGRPVIFFLEYGSIVASVYGYSGKIGDNPGGIEDNLGITVEQWIEAQLLTFPEIERRN